jgi:hypothetical protein
MPFHNKKPPNMARKKARKAAPKKPARRINAARRPRARARRRRMNSATGGVTGAAMEVGKMLLGYVAAEVVKGQAARFVKDPKMLNGGTALLGVVLAAKVPNMRAIGAGVAANGALPLLMPLLSKAGVRMATLNGAPTMDPAQARAIADKVRRAAQLHRGATVNGGTPGTLTGRQPETLVGMSYTFDGEMMQ